MITVIYKFSLLKGECAHDDVSNKYILFIQGECDLDDGYNILSLFKRKVSTVMTVINVFSLLKEVSTMMSVINIFSLFKGKCVQDVCGDSRISD